MPHQLAQCHGPLFLRERRHVGLNLVVEVQTALLQQQADCGGGERRRRRSDPEPHFWRDWHPVLEIRPAKAFGPHDVATDTDRHRDSGQVLLDETRTDDLPPLLHGVGPLWQRGRTRHGRHLLRVRVQRRCSGARVRPKPQNRREQQADGPDDHREPGLFPTLHVNFLRGASPLGLPYTRPRSPLRRLAPGAGLARTARSPLAGSPGARSHSARSATRRLPVSPRGFAPRTPLHAPSLAAPPARSLARDRHSIHRPGPYALKINFTIQSYLGQCALLPRKMGWPCLGNETPEGG